MAACQYFKLKHSTRLFLIIKTTFVFIIAKYFALKEAPTSKKIEKY
jgi:hypothetical protein